MIDPKALEAATRSLRNSGHLVPASVMRAAIEAYEAAQWRPIEEAPKNGMFIYTKAKEGRWRIGLSYHTVSDENRDAYGGGSMEHIGATHFRHLPNPPEGG